MGCAPSIHTSENRTVSHSDGEDVDVPGPAPRSIQRWSTAPGLVEPQPRDSGASKVSCTGRGDSLGGRGGVDRRQPPAFAGCRGPRLNGAMTRRLGIRGVRSFPGRSDAGSQFSPSGEGGRPRGWGTRDIPGKVNQGALCSGGSQSRKARVAGTGKGLGCHQFPPPHPLPSLSQPLSPHCTSSFTFPLFFWGGGIEM